MKHQLKIEQTRNEKTKCRIIGLTLETRPDMINEKEILKFREMGATRIEIGVQSVFDEVLAKNKRGHGVEAVVKATKLLKDVGFKVSYHMMPGLYGSDLKKDLEMFKTIFTDSRFQPDLIKIYPCVVVKDSNLYELWKAGKYKSYSDTELKKLLIEVKKITPSYVRISRLIRDIPEESIVAGNKITNLRQVIANNSQLDGWKCQCIRCREIRDNKPVEANSYSPKLNRIDYDASGGKEIFLEVTDNDYQLYAMLRLRFVETNGSSSLQGTAIIREIHTYGEALDIGDTNIDAKQHRGLGRKLIAEAEKITKKAGYKKIAVISGVGAREYYRKLGYGLDGNYMLKVLK